MMTDGKRTKDDDKRLKDAGRAKAPPAPPPGADDDYEDGDIATPKRDRDDQDLGA